jgi:hypothetical protein
MTEPYDVPQRRSPEGEGEAAPEGLFFDPKDLPAATAPSGDWSVFDDVPLDEDGLPVVPTDFDHSQLPGYDQGDHSDSS